MGHKAQYKSSKFLYIESHWHQYSPITGHDPVFLVNTLDRNCLGPSSPCPERAGNLGSLHCCCLPGLAVINSHSPRPPIEVGHTPSQIKLIGTNFPTFTELLSNPEIIVCKMSNGIKSWYFVPKSSLYCSWVWMSWVAVWLKTTIIRNLWRQIMRHERPENCACSLLNICLS